ncbi:catalytic/ protein phosphatase type 2C [Panicum miliaceum]|uniref:protein-serine/threonine phosphatase n=1 Tax=Panicum miliaceum TaxID=4540 RepID=A0A3L6T7B2_PANMI|nr:catalytic/ protein phosphatase type 2C [Panicum miliaceum]
MRQISSLLQGLARSLSVGRDRRGDGGAGDGKAAAPAVLRTSGTVWGEGSETFAAVCSRRGEKGTNQDCSIVWEGFGCQEDTIFCGIFDGHGPWGHYVAKAVRDSLPPSLLEKAAKRLVECAVRAWRRRRQGIAVDDCSAICLFFHSPPS